MKDNYRLPGRHRRQAWLLQWGIGDIRPRRGVNEKQS
jgi:hypothetical protein